jgi:hypothetical protein
MSVDEAINHADALALARQQIRTLERRFDIASRGLLSAAFALAAGDAHKCEMHIQEAMKKISEDYRK